MALLLLLLSIFVVREHNTAIMPSFTVITVPAVALPPPQE